MSIHEDIKKRFVRLSKGQRKVAQFVMDNPTTVIANGAAEVGRLANVSESTVIRFCYAMDLSGYVELQEEVRGFIMSQDVGANLQPTYTAKKLTNSSFGKVMQRDSQNIQETIHLINDQQIQKCSKWMHEADNIYILGTRHNASVANWLSNTLKTLRANIKQLRLDSDDLVNQINSMGEHTTLIVLSFDKQIVDIKTIVEIAKVKKVKIIAITGSAFSPIREYASALFTLGTKNHSSLDIAPVLISFLHALIEEMISQDKDHYDKYQQLYEQVESNVLFLDAIREKQVF
ncbi:MurR/RpiR family transcriptional regulator [Lysinibacillus capsici]|uniref:Transcriptional regulator n=1 Tax=Lysinibacillus capsici TaxID=2115968 RepID=A0A2X0XH88_9BACI|nr:MULTISPECIES: MurR/RpiR family transcriptional regulator [Lysinibacillus]MDP1394931.1 MurR/RpiR family transcriptional regulator [Lysinibacillus capsici]MDP1415570.1 MurR/RpiR family transcriptional regulator [Lysinibacillus capsici]MDP1431294.1 MurR/RpiR family transcriptional regulator [Lysinibacillus capsici]MEC1302241.1 MurR/RpiR family transcriptional regulator [Lysinibacillus capsici]MED3796393.1 MurR/RpiR family transcriptional regulator [Lysinibacillus capsici]